MKPEISNVEYEIWSTTGFKDQVTFFREYSSKTACRYRGPYDAGITKASLRRLVGAIRRCVLEGNFRVIPSVYSWMATRLYDIPQRTNGQYVTEIRLWEFWEAVMARIRDHERNKHGEGEDCVKEIFGL